MGICSAYNTTGSFDFHSGGTVTFQVDLPEEDLHAFIEDIDFTVINIQS